MDWIQLAQARSMLGTCEHCNWPGVSGKYGGRLHYTVTNIGIYLQCEVRTWLQELRRILMSKNTLSVWWSVSWRTAREQRHLIKGRAFDWAESDRCSSEKVRGTDLSAIGHVVLLRFVGTSSERSKSRTLMFTNIETRLYLWIHDALDYS